jgi:hypothetical protein
MIRGGGRTSAAAMCAAAMCAAAGIPRGGGALDGAAGGDGM